MNKIDFIQLYQFEQFRIGNDTLYQHKEVDLTIWYSKDHYRVVSEHSENRIIFWGPKFNWLQIAQIISLLKLSNP